MSMAWLVWNWGEGWGAAAGPHDSSCSVLRRWLQAHPSVTLCPLTSTLRQAPLVRIAVEPSGRNGLHKPSQLMVDKLFTVSAVAVGEVVGQLEPQVLVDLDLALRSWLELP
jgi:mRNA interferase MazF